MKMYNAFLNNSYIYVGSCMLWGKGVLVENNIH